MELGRHEKIFLAAIVVFIVAGCGIWLWRVETAGAGTDDIISLEENTEKNANENAPADGEKVKPEVCVHIVGAVANPGVYSLPDGSRLYELVAMAGGTAAGADSSAVNMAEVLSDGMQYRMPVMGEALPQQPAGAGGGSGQTASGDKIDINHADTQELDKIPGVGEATAAKIISFREKNGRFSKIEDLMEVSGIGEKKFESMKDVITVK